jgi:hypothetical protein
VRGIKGSYQEGNRAMNKFLAVATFAAFAFAAQTAAACEWNREASSQEQTVATTATPSEPAQATQQTAPSQPPASTVASDQGTRQPAESAAPIVLVNDRH